MMGAAIIGAVLLVAVIFALVTIIKNTYVCPPSEVLIFSGRSWPLPPGAGDGQRRTVGFRVVRGGRAMRIPLIEVVDRMPLTNMAIELTVTNAFSRGGIPLKVQAVANVKIPSEEPLLHNAIERFLGYPRERFIAIAKDTLEGNLRGVIAELTPEEINQQKVIFQQKLVEEADRDLHRLGLTLDNLQIQNISDEVGYLSSVGRVRGALVTKNGRIGELRAWASAQVQKSQSAMQSEVAKLETELQIAQKEAERRIIEAKTQREAVIAEIRGKVSAQVAEARAQLLSWEARIEQTRRKLEADVVAEASATQKQQEQKAKAEAAAVVAQGRAAAEALLRLAEAYKASGGRARDAMLLQKLVPVFKELTSSMQPVRIERYTVLGGSGDGGAAGLGGALSGVVEQVRAATGLDLRQLLPGSAPSPATPLSAPPPPAQKRDKP